MQLLRPLSTRWHLNLRGQESYRQPKPEALFLCERQFSYRGRKLNCDSFHQTDAENLREIIQDVPSALEELNTYQDTRRNVRRVAYLETLGLVSMIAGTILSPSPIGDDGKIRRGGYFLFGGMLVAGEVFYTAFRLPALTRRV